MAAFYTVEEVAEALRVDPAAIYRAIRAGEFPAVKIRKRYVVPEKAIELLVEDVMATGGCVDTSEWTTTWRQTVGAPVEIPSWARSGAGPAPGGGRCRRQRRSCLLVAP